MYYILCYMNKTKAVNARVDKELWEELPVQGRSTFVREAIEQRLSDDWIQKGDYDIVTQENKMVRWQNQRLRRRVRVLSILLLLLAVSVVVLALAVAGIL